MIKGALAAAVTPLVEGGEALDEQAIAPYVEFLVAHGVDGMFVLGTTGEGILLRREERQRAAEVFLAAAAGRIASVVHCGAQTTSETAALAGHAAANGADAVAVIPPPYFSYDDEALAEHFLAAARACAPVAFYLYEFAARSGYAIPLGVVDRLRAEAPNLAGLKVSDAPWESFEPYLVEGRDVFVGPEALIERGLAAGAAGAVSGLAAAFPEVVVELVRSPTSTGSERVAALRAELQRVPFNAAAKLVLGLRGLPVGEAVRRPLRTLTAEERIQLEEAVSPWLESSSPASSDRLST
jgi:dihydrodipicolinate synthase/N-acetylneuraminate lyase